MGDSRTANIQKIYYFLKPIIPRWAQIALRSAMVLRKRSLCRDVWPIDERTATAPEGWPGWPEEKKFAFILTHDVDTARGQDKCRALMELEEASGFRSSFNFVPRRYEVSPELRSLLVAAGFEVGVHGLYHDGKLYDSRELFQQRAGEINRYIEEWGAVGFRSPSMQHNLDWIHDLNIAYDASTFDTDPFEPQSDGIGTVFPLYIKGDAARKGYVELPYTLPQDFTLFVLMGEKKTDTWKTKLDWIAENGGMALMNTHPDYMNFGARKSTREEYPAHYYAEFLHYVKDQYRNDYWHVLPRDVSAFWERSFREGRS